MAPNNKIWKRQPTKDGRNAKQRRADEKRAARLSSEPHLAAVAADQKKERYLQSQRWVDHNMRTSEIFGYENEIRWGLKTGMTFLLSDGAQHTLDRLDRERREALNRVKTERKEAGLDDVVEWVDDWFGQTVTGGVGGAGISAGGETQGEGIDHKMEDMEGKETEGKHEPEGKGLDDFDQLSDVEMGD